MTRQLFIDGWTWGRAGDSAYAPVVLPHDAMIAERRTGDAPSSFHGAYFPGGRYVYRKTWNTHAGLEGKEVSLRFEGVYRRSRVLLDGRELGGSVSGYREFDVRLDPYINADATHVLEVHVDNSETPGSRWYTGSGIYRPVWLDIREPIHLDGDGVQLATSAHGPDAAVLVQVPVANPGLAALNIEVTLSHNGRIVATGRAGVEGSTTEIGLTVPDALFWSAEAPTLYDLDLVLRLGDHQADQLTLPVGLRVVTLDPARGLLVNGLPVTLRGANLHHDNGVLGAATLPGTELRRVRTLKAAGFTAIRSAHNQASRALLDACDQLGMYVMDEAFDGWYDHKTEADEAENFQDIWRDELTSMVRKDRLHPSVIMYSIGNENGEALTPRGRRVAAEMVAELRRLDPSRFTTIGVNLVAATFAGIARSHTKEAPAVASLSAPDMTSTALNVISNRFGLLMKAFPKLKAADRSTTDLFDLFDVAGYNYGTSRYTQDAALHPSRIMVGTESMPGDIATNWNLVERLPSLIGDFMWAGWDYMGEAGGGSWTYGTRSAPFLKPFPQLVSGMGVIDLNGDAGAAVLLAKAAWGLLKAPGIAVRPLDVAPGPIARTAWRATDAIPSWSWSGHDGEPAEIQIYSTDDEVEVRINGRSLGRKPSGRSHGFVTHFRSRYEAGTLEAFGYRNGAVVSRSELHSASAVRLRITCDAEERGPLGVAFLRVDLADDAGVVDSGSTDLISVDVSGDGWLAGFGNAAPATTESFSDTEHSTYRGRALAVIRTTSDGPVLVTARSRRHGEASVHIASILEKAHP